MKMPTNRDVENTKISLDDSNNREAIATLNLSPSLAETEMLLNACLNRVSLKSIDAFFFRFNQRQRQNKLS